MLILTYIVYEIIELTKNDNCFVYDSLLWTSPDITNSVSYSTCGSTYLVGGYETFNTINQLDTGFIRSYTGLPSHAMIYFTITIWAIDSWNANMDYFKVQFDSTTFTGWNSWDYNNFATSDICGNSLYQDLSGSRIFGRMTHSLSTLTMKIISELDDDSSNESLGFRDINLLFITSPTVTTETLCGKASIAIGGSLECSCDEGQYLSSGVCTACHSSCGSCFGFGADYCYQCASGYGFNGAKCVQCDSSCSRCYGTTNSQCNECQSGYVLVTNNTCVPQSNCNSPLSVTGCGRYCDPPCQNIYWSYWDNTCLSTCNLPLKSVVVATGLSLISSVNYCEYPCSNSQYLYWDGSCQATCDFPFVQRADRDRNICDFPCASTEYVYWNGSCSSSCALPLKQSTVNSRMLCTYPCASTEYLYSNGTCVTYCDSSFGSVQEGGKSFCRSPCASTAVVYWNSSCATACALPLVADTISGANVCRYPCASGQYLYSDGSCSNFCSSYFVAAQEGGKNFCRSPCASSNFVYWNGSCLSSCATPLVQDTISNAKICKYPCASYEFLYSDGTCSSSCNSYFISIQEGDKVFCRSPCPATSIVYWDQECISTCQSPLIKDTISNTNICRYPCATNEYLYSNGTCASFCDSYFVQTQVEGLNLCKSPCATTDVVYWNQSCINNCVTPLVKDKISNTNVCRYPCPSDQYLYPNGTCSSSCISYFAVSQEGGRNFCRSPCASTEFAYWDGSCDTKCASPLVPDTIAGSKICSYPCLTNQYLNPNGACTSSCDSYFQVEEVVDRNLCTSPCTNGQILYWDQSCASTCNSPLLSHTLYSIAICRYSCLDTEYLYQNKSCLASCDFPYTPRVENLKNFCGSSCSSTQWITSDDSCVSSCQFPMRAVINNYGAFCLPPCDSASDYYYPSYDTCKSYCSQEVRKVDGYKECLPITKPVVSKLLHPIKYLDVVETPSLQEMSVIRGNNILSIRVVPEMFQKLTGFFHSAPLASVFAKRDLNSSFIVNFMDDLILLAILLCAEAALSIVRLGAIKYQIRNLQQITEKIQVLTRFNLPLMLIATNIGDILFFSIIQFRSFDPKISGSALSLIVSLLMLGIAIAFLVVTSYLVYKAMKAKRDKVKDRSSPSFTAFANKWRNFQVLFGGSDPSTELSEPLFLVYTIRLAVPMFFAAILDMVPFTESVIYLSTNILMVGYILILNPIKSKVNHINVLLIELILLTANMSAAILSGFDGSRTLSKGYRKSIVTLSDTIIICGYLIQYLAVFFLIIKVVLILRKARQLKKENLKKQDMSFLYQLLFIPFQQGCMGFEEVQVSQPAFAFNNKAKGTIFPETMATINNLAVTRHDITLPRGNGKADPSDTPSMNTILLERTKIHDVGRPVSGFTNEVDGKSLLEKELPTSTMNLQNESQVQNDKPAAQRMKMLFGSSLRKKATNKKGNDNPEIATINLEEDSRKPGQEKPTSMLEFEDDLGSPMYKFKSDEQELKGTPEKSLNLSRMASEVSLLKQTNQPSSTFTFVHVDTLSKKSQTQNLEKNLNNEQSKNPQINLFDAKKNASAKRITNLKLNASKPEQTIHIKPADVIEPEAAVFKLDIEDNVLKAPLQGVTTIQAIPQAESLLYKLQETPNLLPNTENEATKNTKIELFDVKKSGAKRGKSSKQEEKKVGIKLTDPPEQETPILRLGAESNVVKSPTQGDSPIKENLVIEPAKVKEPEIKTPKQDIVNEPTTDSKFDKNNPRIKSLKSFKWEAKEDETKKAKTPEPNLVIPQSSTQTEIIKSPIQEDNTIKQNPINEPVKDKEPKIESLKQDIENESTKSSKLDSSTAKKDPQIKSIKSFKWEAKEDEAKKAKIPEPNLVIPQSSAQNEVIKSPIQGDNAIKQNPINDPVKDKEPKIESLKQDIENENTKSSKLDPSTAKKDPQIKSIKSFKWESKESEQKKAKIPKVEVSVFQLGAQNEETKSPQQGTPINQEEESLMLGPDAKIAKFRLLFDPSGNKKEITQKEKGTSGISKLDLDAKNAASPKIELPISTTNLNNEVSKPAAVNSRKDLDSKLKRLDTEITLFKLGEDDDAQSPQRGVESPLIDANNGSPTKSGDVVIEPFRMFFNPAQKKKGKQ